MACSFCEAKRSINTTVGEFILKLSMDNEHNNYLKIRVEQGGIGRTRPVRIMFCPMCGKGLSND